jgi:uncharacterized protein YsxB (DUF464 family)
MRLNLSLSDIGELVGVCAALSAISVAFLRWYTNQLRNEILAECKGYLYVLQERVQGNEVELNHLNNHAEKAWPRFQRLILSIRRRDIDEVR